MFILFRGDFTIILFYPIVFKPTKKSVTGEGGHFGLKYWYHQKAHPGPIPNLQTDIPNFCFQAQ